VEYGLEVGTGSVARKQVLAFENMLIDKTVVTISNDATKMKFGDVNKTIETVRIHVIESRMGSDATLSNFTEVALQS